MPILDVSVKDVNPETMNLTGDDSVLVKYYSRAEATMTMQYGEIIEDTCIIENGENKVTGVSQTIFENVENDYFLFKCENTQFIHFKKELTAPMVDYVKLTCNVLPSNIDGNGNMRVACYGNAFFGSFGAVDNEIEAWCRIKKRTGSYGSWQEMDVEQLTDTTYLASVDLSVSDYEGQYVAEILVRDKLEDVTKTETKASKPIFHWGRNDFAFEVPVYFNSDVYFNESFFTSGTWTPYLDSDAVDEYHIDGQDGWYIKVGNTVTVGFYIKADCYSGYDDTKIVIRDLPFTPWIRASGGGMCSGAYVSAEKTFQCFVAETDGTITTRVQNCENLSGDNLKTSAIGCLYPEDGGEITLSGTITYLTYD